MNKPMLSLLVLLSAASTAAFAQQQDMTLQQERDQMGADLEDNRQQIGRDINPNPRVGCLAESDAGHQSRRRAERCDQSAAKRSRYRQPAGRDRLAAPGRYAAAQWWCRDCPTPDAADSGARQVVPMETPARAASPARWIGNE